MVATWHNIEVAGHPMPVYLSVPEYGVNFPTGGVVVAQHAGGVDDFIGAMCDRLAEAGLVAAAPNLYHRQDDNILEEYPAGHPDRMEKLFSKMAQFKDDEIEADVNATVAWLQGMRVCHGAPIGIIGFCMGGRVSLFMAERSTELAGSAIFYGAAMDRPWGEGKAPLDEVAKVSAPIIGFFGNDDQNPSPELVEKLSAELTKNEKQHDFHSYDGAGHAFMDSTNPNAHRPEAEADAFPKLVEFFKSSLGVQSGIARSSSVPRAE